MPPKRKRLDPEKKAQFIANVRREKAQRQQGYREQALKLFPHVCARCGREFSGPALRELTVHHKDSNHMNNPPDGSNWELLCLYCHDDEHQDYERSGYGQGAVLSSHPDAPAGFQPFEGLGDLLKPKDPDKDSA